MKSRELLVALVLAMSHMASCLVMRYDGEQVWECTFTSREQALVQLFKFAIQKTHFQFKFELKSPFNH